jgi:hypothetical protein
MGQKGDAEIFSESVLPIFVPAIPRGDMIMFMSIFIPA